MEKIQTVQCPSLILPEFCFVNFKPAIENQYKNLKKADMRYASKGFIVSCMMIKNGILNS
ncbi:hypothetical protein [Chryseobacterium sp. NFX27]|uniref:hypothetical protein n=1 Tax=Chryseobacterium sp. NFX27 TaxID=2819618 RepID=UPI003CF8BE34